MFPYLFSLSTRLKQHNNTTADVSPLNVIFFLSLCLSVYDVVTTDAEEEEEEEEETEQGRKGKGKGKGKRTEKAKKKRKRTVSPGEEIDCF